MCVRTYMSVSIHTDFHRDTLISPIPLSSWIWWLAFGVTSRQRTRPHSTASSPSPPLFLAPTEWMEKTGDLAVGLWGKWATSCHRLNRLFETWFAGFKRVSDCKADKWRECEGVAFIQKIKKTGLMEICQHWCYAYHCRVFIRWTSLQQEIKGGDGSCESILCWWQAEGTRQKQQGKSLWILYANN